MSSTTEIRTGSNSRVRQNTVEHDVEHSVWCTIAVAFQRVDTVYKQEAQAFGLTVIEWHVLRTLYERDGLMAGQLARAVGRAPTSFTPTIDAIVRKGLIQRSAHPSNRRSVRIHLTSKGEALKVPLVASAQRIEGKIRQQFTDKEWQCYQHVIENFQRIRPAQNI